MRSATNQQQPSRTKSSRWQRRSNHRSAGVYTGLNIAQSSRQYAFRRITTEVPHQSSTAKVAAFIRQQPRSADSESISQRTSSRECPPLHQRTISERTSQLHHARQINRPKSESLLRIENNQQASRAHQHSNGNGQLSLLWPS